MFIRFFVLQGGILSYFLVGQIANLPYSFKKKISTGGFAPRPPLATTMTKGKRVKELKYGF